MYKMQVRVSMALALAAAERLQQEEDPRMRLFRLRPDHIPREEAPQLEIARRAELLKARDEPLYRIDTNPRSIRGTIALTRSRHKKKRP